MSGRASGGSGPEWFDVNQFMVALEVQWEVKMSLVCTTGPGASSGPRWSLVAVAMPSLRSGASVGPQPSWAVEVNFPSNYHRTLEGAVYRACYAMDTLLGEERLVQLSFA